MKRSKNREGQLFVGLVSRWVLVSDSGVSSSRDPQTSDCVLKLAPVSRHDVCRFEARPLPPHDYLAVAPPNVTGTEWTDAAFRQSCR